MATLDAMPPDFFNSREDALLVWMTVIVALAFVKSPREIGSSLWACVRALVQWKLLLLFGSALLYSGLIVWGAKEIGLWHENALKATIYWFFVTGVVLLGEAVGRADPSDPDLRLRIIARVISLTIVAEFIVNLYAFPLGYELILTFAAITAVGVHVLLRDDRAILVLGVILLAHFFFRAVTDLDGFLTRENAEDFLVGLILTITLVPLLYPWAWMSRWEQNRLRRRFRPQRGHA
jgi:hypothetical protein